MATAWYARMADIPGIQFAGSPGVDRARLPEARSRPKLVSGQLSWPSAGGRGSASPAHERAFSQEEPSRVDDLVRWVWEGLELPGIPSDYHFLLQHAVEKLWFRRIEAPAALYHLEVFGWLDLALLEPAPDLARIDRPEDGPKFFRITSFERLLSLLEREGALRDAVALSRRASRFGDRYRLAELEAKLAVLDGEAR